MHNQHSMARISRVSFFIMGATIAVCTLIYVIVLTFSGPPHYMMSATLLKPLAIPITLSIASNQLIHSVRELMDSIGAEEERNLGLDDISRAVTKTVTPFAAVVVAVGVNNQYHLWMLVGLCPLIPLFVDPRIHRWGQKHRSD